MSASGHCGGIAALRVVDRCILWSLRVPMRMFAVVLGALLAVAAVAFDDTVHSGGGRLYIHVEDDGFDLSDRDIVGWIQRSANVVTDYYGRFPTQEAYVAVIGVDGKGVMHGTALGEAAAVINVTVGRSTDKQDLRDDWVLVHELIHLAFPKLQSRHHWAEEGLSVYVESVARAQAGDLSPHTMWAHFVAGMSNGLPREGDRGLDNTSTWGRVYWGGALFFLLADLEIIERSQGAMSLRSGLRAIVEAGFNITSKSTPPDLFRIADKATGLTVLRDLYGQMADGPIHTDLDRLWRRLGIERTGSGIVLLDHGELTEVRRSVTRSAPVARPGHDSS